MKGKMVQQMYAGTVINQRRDIIWPAHGLMLCIKIDKCVAHVTKHKRIIEFVTNSELHRLCTTFPKEDRAGCWCDICGRSYNDHISSTIAVEIIVTDVTEDVFENRHRSILTERIEAQWVSGPCHFQVSDK